MDSSTNDDAFNLLINNFFYEVGWKAKFIFLLALSFTEKPKSSWIYGSHNIKYNNIDNGVFPWEEKGSVHPWEVAARARGGLLFLQVSPGIPRCDFTLQVLLVQPLDMLLKIVLALHHGLSINKMHPLRRGSQDEDVLHLQVGVQQDTSQYCLYCIRLRHFNSSNGAYNH